MKQIFIFLLAIIGVAYGQSSPTSAKTRFVNGIYLGTKLDSYFNAADSNAVYWRADSSLMAKYKGTARALAFAVSGGYLPISDTAAMLSGYKTYYPRTAISAGTGISYNAATGVITNSSPSSGGTVTSVSAGTGMSFTTITSSGAVNADTTVLATRAYAAGLDVAKANTSLNNVNGVLSSTYGGAGSVSGILKANGSGTVSAAVAGTDYVAPSALSWYLPLSGGTLTGALSGTSLSMSGGGGFNGLVTLGSGYYVNAGSENRYYNAAGSNWAIIQGGSFTGSGLGEIKVTGGSGNGILLANSGNLLIKTTTDNGTDALQVAGSVSATSSVTALTLASTAGISSGSSVTATTAMSVSGNTTPKFQLNRGTYTTSALNEYSNNNSLRWTTGLNSSQGGYVIRNVVAGNNAVVIDTLSNMTVTGGVTGNGYRFAYSAKSSNYTLTDNDDYINVTSSCTITLPTAVGRSGKRYVIKCVGSVTATIASTSSQTIDGNAASTYTFGGPNFNIMIVYSDGANWRLEAWQTGI